MEIIKVIDEKIGEVRTESLDISIGELIALYENQELVIQPDFQRLFRWSIDQRSRLIESILLELPIPSIFVIERENGVFELIDGLQRISTVIQFLSSEKLGLDKLILDGCDLVPQLNKLSFSELPLTLQLRIKRSGIRTVVIKRQSSQFLRYEMFKRLNTGGSKLSDQDIRNVNARMLGDDGVRFYDFIVECSSQTDYMATMELLPTSAVEARLNEELVLRFFAAKNFRDKYKGNISDWLDSYMEEILIKKIKFNFTLEKQSFDQLFKCLNSKFGNSAFVRYRNGLPIGGVAPAYFEAVSVGGNMALSSLEAMPPEKAKEILSSTVESDNFREVTGPGANSQEKLTRRIGLISEAFSQK